MPDTKPSILVVDDVESIRIAIKDYLGKHYTLHEADNGLTALSILKEKKIDLVLTDIRMPEMGGLELIRHLKRGFPGIKFALMTAYNVDEYVQYARNEEIWNIIPKTTLLDLHFVQVMIDKLISNNIFGVEKYFPGVELLPTLSFQYAKQQWQQGEKLELEKNQLYSVTVHSMDDANFINDRISTLMVKSGSPFLIRQILEELSSNALVRAPGTTHTQNAPSTFWSARNTPVKLKPEEWEGVTISFGIVKNNAVLCVSDPFGTLDRNEILYRLERQITIDLKTGLPSGLADLHGRGLFIAREHTDQLIFNIDPGNRTEVIALLSLETESRNRAISIYQTSEESPGSPLRMKKN